MIGDETSLTPMDDRGTRSPVVYWRYAFCDIFGDCSVTIPAAIECLWPWLLTDVAVALRYFPPAIGRTKRTFFLTLLFAVFVGAGASLGVEVINEVCASQWMESDRVGLLERDSTDECDLLVAVRFLLGLISSLLSLLICYAIFLLRRRARQIKGMYLADAEDAILSCLCPCCTIIQTSREVDVGPEVAYCSCDNTLRPTTQIVSMAEIC